MKKQFALLITLAMVFSSFSLAYKIVPAAKATNVEGAITQDTIWTLVDSPFIPTGNVTVNPAATLTIEPGVEVRFGGDFSLIINGKIIAQGTHERKILFTTNDPSHNILWNTIELNSLQSSSFLNCIIEYGKNATTLRDGLLEIQDSTIRFNSENGITMNGGSLNLINSELADNIAAAINVEDGILANIENNIINSSRTGVRIAGCQQVSARGNTIISNTDGLVLTGNLTGNIDVRQNEITLSSQNGILLESDAYDNTVITENNVSSNGCGFYVSANASTYIARNYVSNNTLGFYYSGPANHQIYFNDIYDNQFAVELDSSYVATVNAAHNYWGHRTGPKHDSLNPYGKGNQIGGDGVKLVFTPFLTHQFTYNNMPPTAVLWTDKILVSPYQTVTFIGTESNDDGSVDKYFYDFGDTLTSGWTPLSLYNHSYSSAGTYVTSLIVEDDFESISAPTSATVVVADLTPLTVTVSLNNSTVPYNGETWATAYVSDGIGAVPNADVTLFSVIGGIFEPQSGLTDANGYFTAKYTAPAVEEMTDVRIIARASMNGYADGSDYEYLRVLPPLEVQIIPADASVRSGETTPLNIYVTNSLEEPVSNSTIVLSCTNGSLSTYSGTTDSNGAATVIFNAPETLESINVTVSVEATRSDYADSHGEVTIPIEPKRLDVLVTANPEIVLSEGATNITVLVTFDSAPISDAMVTVSSDAGGYFSMITEPTDDTGTSRITFTAPQTISTDGINATITAKVTKSGYVEAENRTVIAVEPKILSVQIIPRSQAIYANGKLNITVHAEYNTTSIQGANITVTATNGTFTPTTGLTDLFGNVTFTFNAPWVNENSNLTLSAVATKEGYIGNEDHRDIAVTLRTFSIQVTPSTVRSGQVETVKFIISCTEDASPVNGATVALTYESVGPLENITDFTGTCSFVINVPQVEGHQFNVSLTVSRFGYSDKQVNMVLNVAPSEGGFPLTILLLAMVPVIIAVVVVVLVKKRVLVFSAKDEETQGQSTVS